MDVGPGVYLEALLFFRNILNTKLATETGMLHLSNTQDRDSSACLSLLADTQPISLSHTSI